MPVGQLGETSMFKSSKLQKIKKQPNKQKTGFQVKELAELKPY